MSLLNPANRVNKSSEAKPARLTVADLSGRAVPNGKFSRDDLETNAVELTAVHWAGPAGSLSTPIDGGSKERTVSRSIVFSSANVQRAGAKQKYKPEPIAEEEDAENDSRGSSEDVRSPQSRSSLLTVQPDPDKTFFGERREPSDTLSDSERDRASDNGRV